jgi:hypothetical protein
MPKLVSNPVGESVSHYPTATNLCSGHAAIIDCSGSSRVAIWANRTNVMAIKQNDGKNEVEGITVGHWYNWVRVRNASIENAHEIESTFHAWPGPQDESDATVFSVLGSGKIEDNDGKNTIYMLSRPADLNTGDTMRIYGHCLYHGEYVDFVDFTLEQR